MAQMLDDILARLNGLPEKDRSSVIADAMTITKDMAFVPNVGPQTAAYFSLADEMFFGGCVSGDTEFLTPYGWKRIDTYATGDLVAQWRESGSLDWVYPDGYTDAPCTELIRFSNTRLSMLLSDEHRMPMYDYEGKFVVKRAADVAAVPSRHKIPVHFSPVSPGMDMSDDLIRLGVAIHADGNLTYRKKDGGAHCRISLRKQRKIDRLESLLGRLGIEWHEYRNPSRPTEVRYGFDSPILTKSYIGPWWFASPHQLAIVLEEMSYWDGCISGAEGGDISFDSARKIDADFIQYAAHACGRVATITERPTAERHATIHRVFISRAGSVKSSMVLRGDAIDIDRVPANRMYCFTVPTSFWLARHNGCVFVTGNSPGCGKSALLCGLALTDHKKTLLLRREYPQVKGLIDEVKRIVGTKDGYNGQDKIWRNLPGGREIEFGSCQHEDDKENYQGRAHDLKGFDEITHFTESQYRYIIGWNRSTDRGQRCRVVCTGNPPTSATGLWVIKYWGPWLDKNHPSPAKPGELRWFTTIDGKDTEVDGRGPYEIDGREVYARSRTYVPGKLEDNPDLAETGYASVIEAMPEPMRTMMREARFDLSVSDDPWQAIPSAWVHAAQERWTQYAPQGIPMCAIAADVAQGGKDNNVIAIRYDGWFAPLETIPGVMTPLGKDCAGILVSRRRDNATVLVDCGGGYGGSTYKTLKDNGIDCVAYKGAEGSDARTTDRLLTFKNVRTAAYWKLREALDPDQPGGSHVALPPSTKLVAHLTCPTYEVVGNKIVMMTKEEVTKVLGESPDEGDAVVMCWWAGARMNTLNGGWSGTKSGNKPKVVLGRDNIRRRA